MSKLFRKLFKKDRKGEKNLLQTSENLETSTTSKRKECEFCSVCSKPENVQCKKKILSPVPSPQPNKTNIPYDVLPGNLSILQCDTIMSLVSIAENSTTEWWKNYNYVENIGDGRGMTVSLVGFCSGTHDLLWVFNNLRKINPSHQLLKYIPVLLKIDGTDNTRGLETLKQDLEKYGDIYWRKAVWDGILYFYWTPAMNFAEKLKVQSALGKGFLFDLALNHGAEEMSKMSSRCLVPSPAKGGNEQPFLTNLINVRQKIITQEDLSTNSGQPDRCLMWMSILNTGNMNLSRPIKNLKCYGDSFIIL